MVPRIFAHTEMAESHQHRLLGAQLQCPLPTSRKGTLRYDPTFNSEIRDEVEHHMAVPCMTVIMVLIKIVSGVSRRSTISAHLRKLMATPKCLVLEREIREECSHIPCDSKAPRHIDAPL